jgi:hypothetical protein
MSLDSLKYGWASVLFGDGLKCIQVVMSDVGPDPLSGIIDSAIHLALGQDSVVRFILEPEIISYTLNTDADGTFLLNVGHDEFRDSTLRYIRQTLGMFDRYSLNHGEAEYNAHWLHAFPEKKLIA